MDTQLLFNQLVDAIRAEVRAEMVAAIGGSNGTVKRGRRGRRAATVTRSAPRTKGGKRTSEDIEVLTKNLLGYVRKHAGSRMEEIASGLGTTTRELMLPASKLLAEKKLKTTGQKRGMRYSVR